MLSDAQLIIRGLPWTVVLTVSAFAIGAILGLPIMMARRSRFFPVKATAVAFITLVRSIPTLVWLFVIFFGLGSGYIQFSPFAAAVIGLSVIASANMAEIYRGGLLSIHHGQWDAAAALDLGRVNTFRDVIWPQTFRVALPSAATYAVGLLKDSSVASVIGVAEISYRGYQLSQITYRGLDVFGIVAAIYIVIGLPIAWLSRVADSQLRAKVAH